MSGTYVCICDPDDLFDPPDPRPRAVAGCSAHRARRGAQLFTERHPDPPRASLDQQEPTSPAPKEVESA